MDLLAYCDGKENIFLKFGKIIDCDLESAVKELIELKEIRNYLNKLNNNHK